MGPGVICFSRTCINVPGKRCLRDMRKAWCRGFHGSRIVPVRTFCKVFAPSNASASKVFSAQHFKPPTSNRGFAAGCSEPLRFFPPGAKADRGAVEKFVRLVKGALGTGVAVELDAIGSVSVRHAFRAVCCYGSTVQVRLFWEDRISVDDRKVGGSKGHAAEGGLRWDKQKLRLIAQKEDSEQKMHDLKGGFFIERSTDLAKFVEKLVTDLDRIGCFKAHCFQDAPGALGTLALGIATAPEHGTGQPLRCEVASMRREGEARMRVVVNVFDDLHGRGAGTDFRAFPPGRGAQPDEISRFERAVADRLGRGQPVAMECRGADAVWRAMSALARQQGSVAEFRVAWAGARAGGRVLRLRALRGEPWREFSATEFQRTRLLRVTSTTAPLPLARAAGSEVKNRGAVALHAFADDAAGVSSVLKALAMVPAVHGGLRIACVPSLGRAKLPPRPGRPSGGSSVEVLRLYVRLCTRSPAPRLTNPRATAVTIGAHLDADSA